MSEMFDREFPKVSIQFTRSRADARPAVQHSCERVSIGWRGCGSGHPARADADAVVADVLLS